MRSAYATISTDYREFLRGMFVLQPLTLDWEMGSDVDVLDRPKGQVQSHHFNSLGLGRRELFL